MRVLERLQLPRVSLVPLPELEAFDSELAAVKRDRTPVEYCWTATPSLPLFMFGKNPVIDEVTYLDADLMFFADPEPLFEEMGNASVLITPHRFSLESAHHAINGLYNVQFLTFRRDERGLSTLEWWHDRCIEWCYYRLEDGKLGDQKYLDDWPERFAGVHVLRHRGGGVAPWNITSSDIEMGTDGPLVDGQPLIFYHYHRFRLVKDGRHVWRPPGYYIAPSNRRLIYDPYIAELEAAVDGVREVVPGFSAGIEARPTPRERYRLAFASVIAWANWLLARVMPSRLFQRVHARSSQST
jgi:hypothetical protein